MIWFAIAGLVLKLFGPLLAQWLVKLKARLDAAAAAMPEMSTFASPEHGVAALFDRAIDDTPRLHVGERLLLRIVKEMAIPRAAPLAAVAAGTANEALLAPVSDMERRIFALHQDEHGAGAGAGEGEGHAKMEEMDRSHEPAASALAALPIVRDCGACPAAQAEEKGP